MTKRGPLRIAERVIKRKRLRAEIGDHVNINAETRSLGPPPASLLRIFSKVFNKILYV